MRTGRQDGEGSSPGSRRGQSPAGTVPVEPGKDPSHPFDALTPDVIIDAIEAAGFLCDGRVLALGSYENRVYQVGIEEGEPVVVKFYRPGRWSDEAIQEEHDFALELAAAEIPVVAPMAVGEPGRGQCPAGDSTETVPVETRTLLRHAGFRYAVYARRGGQWPELATEDDRQWMGRFLGRIHMVGARRAFEQRPRLSVEAMGRGSVAYLLGSGLIPDYVAHRYERVVDELLGLVEATFADVGEIRFLRIHGDCHRNNVLWTPRGPHFVDLDDCMTGPVIQDLWMLLAGDPAEMRFQLEDFLEGYTQFADFDYRELALIEPLRALRMVHYAAWLARRWDDPAFPMAFPWFGEARYWERHVAELEEQCFAVDRGL